MKNKLVTLLLSSAAIIALWSCKKEENKIFFEGGTAPVLTATASGTIPLTFLTQNQEAITITWTNPEYRFNTGINSQNVNYQVEIDTAGANFTNPNKKVISISNDLSLSMTQSVLNDYLLNQLQLNTINTHNIEIRVKATLANNSVPMYSNVLAFTVKPYAIPPKVNPPASGKLFITGAATPADWQCGCGEAENTSQQFTQVTPTLYVLNSIALDAGESYLLIPRYGTWTAVPPDPDKYGGVGANNTNNPTEDDFKAAGGDLISPSIAGNYKIEVDFQRGKFKLTKL